MNDNALLITGLTLRVILEDLDIDARLGGPAIYAALGSKLAGDSIELITSVPFNLSSEEMKILTSLDHCCSSIHFSENSPLVWYGRSVMNELKGELVGDPRSNSSLTKLNISAKRDIVFTNGDPLFFLDILNKNILNFVSMDLNQDWFFFREYHIHKCLEECNLVTISCHDYNKGGKHFILASKIGQKSNSALIIKDGKRGVECIVDGKSALLPPPILESLNTDISAGDMLIGAMSSFLRQETGKLNLERVTIAYENCMPILQSYMSHSNPWNFLSIYSNSKSEK